MTSPLVRLLPSTSIVVLALAGAGCVVSVDAGQYTTREEKTWKVTAPAEVSLITFDGSIEIRSWDRPEVRVEIERRAADKELADKIEVVASQSGDVITVEAKRPARVESLFGLKVWPSARIVATLPARCNIVARSGDGSISVDRIEGRIELNTGDGSLRGSGLVGSLRAHTGDGSVSFSDLEGSADIDTGDGSGELAGRLAVVRLRTGDGSITVRAEDGSRMTGDWEIRTGDGSIRVELPEAFSASLDATTGDGRVSVRGFGNAGAPPARTDDSEEGRASVRLPLAGGGKLLRLRTGSGGIRVTPL